MVCLSQALFRRRASRYQRHVIFFTDLQAVSLPGPPLGSMGSHSKTHVLVSEVCAWHTANKYAYTVIKSRDQAVCQPKYVAQLA